MSLLIQNVTHSENLKEIDILLSEGIIRNIAPAGTLTPPSGTEILNGTGCLLLPSLVDAHCHLDKTVYGMDWFVNDLGPRITDRIEYERTARKKLGLEPYRQACRFIELAISHGVLHMRSHVDIDDYNKLDGLRGVLAAKEKYKDFIDIETVAFPQSGLLVRPGTLKWMEEAMASGADLVGGLDPAAIDRDPKGSVDAIFSLAEKYDKPIDIHLHEPGELGAFTMELIAARTKAAGMEGRVSVSHAFCLGSPNTSLVSGLLEKLADAEITIITAAQPAMQAPPVKTLIQAGITVCGGNDNMRDMWSPYGTGDMIERAQFIAMKNGFRTDADLSLAFELCSRAGAELMNLKNYGICQGNQADMLLVRAHNLPECIVTCPKDRIVIRKGQIIAKNGQLR